MWQIFPSISDILMKPTQYVVTLPNYFFSQLATLLKKVTRDSNNTISDKLVVFNNYNTHNNVNI